MDKELLNLQIEMCILKIECLMLKSENEFYTNKTSSVVFEAIKKHNDEVIKSLKSLIFSNNQNE